MESEKSEHEVRERGAFPEVCFHCGQPNPVSSARLEAKPTEVR